MNASAPKRGSVIRYAYLWDREHRTGQSEGVKDRPALVMALSVQTDGETTRVFVVAITHSAPSNKSDAVEIPSVVKRNLGLDHSPAWIVTTETNAFIWPGPDVRPIQEGPIGAMVYGQIPNSLLQRVIASYVENHDNKRATIVIR